MPRNRDTRSGMARPPVVSSATAREARSETNWPPSVTAAEAGLCARTGKEAPVATRATAAARTNARRRMESLRLFGGPAIRRKPLRKARRGVVRARRAVANLRFAALTVDAANGGVEIDRVALQVGERLEIALAGVDAGHEA